MTDICSDRAYTSLKATGSLVNDQLSILNVFRKMRVPLTCREAFQVVEADDLKIDFSGVKSRITELTDEGLLEKFDKKTDSVTGKKVNRWRVVNQPVIEKQKEWFETENLTPKQKEK